jgi:Holliday junction resolvasome RuvABC endonuclease subunit
MSETILALDLSTTETGYSICRENRIACFGIIKPSSKLDAIQRSFIIAEDVEKKIVAENIDKIIIEDSYIGFPTSAMLLGKLHGMIAFQSFRYLQKAPLWITATHVRKVMGIKGIKQGKQGKQDIIEVVNHLGFPEVRNDNIADSILLALSYLKEIESGRENQSE